MPVDFSETLLGVVASARDEAIALGASQIGPEHLLLALSLRGPQGTRQLLDRAGLTASDIRARLAVCAAPAGNGGADRGGDTSLTAPAKLAVGRAVQEAAGRRHRQVDGPHLLLGLLRTNPPARAGAASGPGHATPGPGPEVSPVARLIAMMTTSYGELVKLTIAEADARACGEGFPFVGRDLAPVPRRRHRLAWHAGVLAGIAMLGGLALLLAQPAGRFAAALGGVVPLALGVTALPAVARWQVLHRLARPDAQPAAVPGMAAALAPAGVRNLILVCVPAGGRIAGRSAGRAFRFGGMGAILLRPELRSANPDLARFIAAHEAAHVARGDSMNYVLAYTGLIGLCEVLVLGLNPAAWLLLVPAFGGYVMLRWLCELASDRLAVRVAGGVGGDEFIAYLARAAAAARAEPRYRRLAGRITHPPARMRSAAIRRVLATADVTPVTAASVQSLLPAARAAEPGGSPLAVEQANDPANS